MNKVFKSVWSEALGAWVAASELCRGRGKGGRKAARAVVLAVGVMAAGGAFAAGAGTAVSNDGPATAANLTDIAIGSDAKAQSSSKDAIAIGDFANSSADGAIAIGGAVTNAAANSIVIGNAGAGTTGGNAVASMDSASTNSVFLAPAGGQVIASKNSFSFNPYAGIGTSGSDDAVNISGRVIGSPSSVAIGQNASFSNAKTAQNAGVAIGANASVQNANAVAIGANSIASRANSVSVGSGSGATPTRVITNVSNGTKPTDAVTHAQLSAVTDALGGKAEIDSTGAIVAPIYSVISLATKVAAGNAPACATVR
jgi:hypothetical protein